MENNPVTVNDYYLLNPVPKSFWWKLYVYSVATLWLLSDSPTRKSWDEFYYGLIKHEHEYDYDTISYNPTRKTKVTHQFDEHGRKKFGHHSCKHYGCNIVTVFDKNNKLLL